MPTGGRAEIRAKRHLFLAIERTAHEQIVGWKTAESDSDDKEHRRRIGTGGITAGHCPGNERIEAAHEKPRDDADDDSAAACDGPFALALTISNGVADDGGDNERDASEEKQRVAVRGDEVVATAPTTSAMPMPTGKATARPAISMAATRRRLATLKTAPPMSAITI